MTREREPGVIPGLCRNCDSSEDDKPGDRPPPYRMVQGFSRNRSNMPERLLTTVITADTNPLLLEEYIAPNNLYIADRVERVSPFEQTEILAQPVAESKSDRNKLPYTPFNIPEDTAFPSREIVIPPPEYSFDTQKYLSEVDRVQRIFDRAFGRSFEILNYNPVLEIAKFSTLRPEQKAQFPDYEKVQIETALKERFSAATSTIYYEFDEDNKLRSQKLNNQPFEQILQTGIEYYKSLNSSDVPRMEKEREGFLKVQQHLTNPDTPLNTKITVISGSGQVEGTIFKDNFVDVYELLEDPVTKKRTVKMTRFSSNKNYDQYRQEVTTQKSDYFDGQTGPIDEWFLSNPILGEILTDNRKALSEKKMQKILQHTAPHINNLIKKVCEAIINPENINDALKAVLNKADFVWESLQAITQKVTSFISKVRETIMPIFKNFAEELHWLSQLPVRAVAGGCGLSAAYSSLGRGIRLGNLVSGISLGQSIAIGGYFGFTGESGKKGKTCINCGEVNYCTKRCYKCEGMLV